MAAAEGLVVETQLAATTFRLQLMPAQALGRDLTLVSRDRRLDPYGVPILRA